MSVRIFSWEYSVPGLEEIFSRTASRSIRFNPTVSTPITGAALARTKTILDAITTNRSFTRKSSVSRTQDFSILHRENPLHPVGNLLVMGHDQNGDSELAIEIKKQVDDPLAVL